MAHNCNFQHSTGYNVRARLDVVSYAAHFNSQHIREHHIDTIELSEAIFVNLEHIDFLGNIAAQLGKGWYAFVDPAFITILDTCPRCHNDKWVYVYDNDGDFTYQPCPLCNDK